MPEFVIVDRIEDGIAVLEYAEKNMVGVPVAKLPQGVREGDALMLSDGGYALDPDETARRRKENLDLFNSLLED